MFGEQIIGGREAGAGDDRIDTEGSAGYCLVLLLTSNMINLGSRNS